MIIDVFTKVGNTEYKFHIDEKDELEALHKAAVFGNPPIFCQLCKNDNFFKLDSNKDKEGNTYINVVCKACTAKSKLGKYKTGGYFWHKFEEWKKNDSSTQEETGVPF